MKNCIFIFALLLTCCQIPHYATFTGFEQGTTYTIKVKSPSGGLQSSIDSLFREIDLTFSMFDPASLVSRINRNEASETTPLFDECFSLARQIHAQTDGFYDPTVKPLVDAWGFGPGKQQDIPCVECIKEYVGFEKIRIENGRIVKSDPRVELDFSSIAKGFTVDCLARMLENLGATDYLIEVGGEIRAKGVNEAGRAWRIQIDKPSGGFAHEQETVLSLGGPVEPGGSGRPGDPDRRKGSSGGPGGSGKSGTPTSVATSGNYRNRFVDSSGRTRVHTIDPKTGQPVSGEILSVSIAGADCATADGWATGIMACGSVETARRLLANASDIEYYIIYSLPDGGTDSMYSDGFPVENENENGGGDGN